MFVLLLLIWFCQRHNAHRTNWNLHENNLQMFNQFCWTSCLLFGLSQRIHETNGTLLLMRRPIEVVQNKTSDIHSFISVKVHTLCFAYRKRLAQTNIFQHRLWFNLIQVSHIWKRSVPYRTDPFNVHQRPV